MDMSRDHEAPKYNRRSVLFGVGGISTAGVLPGTLTSETIGSDVGSSGDGIPDTVKRSHAFESFINRYYDTTWYSGLTVGEKDLLLDVRSVGAVDIPTSVKHFLIQLFAEQDIHLHWLDYKHRYDQAQFYDRYGPNSRSILWSRDSFYHTVVENRMHDIALQVVLIKGILDGPQRGKIYSPWADVLGERGGFINGMNFGNRLVAAERAARWEQTRLLFHEIAHLSLCHDSAPGNTGVMGTNAALRLTTNEWEIFRNNLDNVNDRTGSDVIFRECLWTDDFGGIG